MRLIKFRGKEIKITEADRNKLLKRWDVDKAKKDEDWDFRIAVKCHFCEKHGLCAGCPLYHCSNMMGAILTRKQRLAINPLVFSVWWSREDNAVARRGILRIRKAILDLPRV